MLQWITAFSILMILSGCGTLMAVSLEQQNEEMKKRKEAVEKEILANKEQEQKEAEIEDTTTVQGDEEDLEPIDPTDSGGDQAAVSSEEVFGLQLSFDEQNWEITGEEDRGDNGEIRTFGIEDLREDQQIERIQVLYFSDDKLPVNPFPAGQAMKDLIKEMKANTEAKQSFEVIHEQNQDAMFRYTSEPVDEEYADHSALVRVVSSEKGIHVIEYVYKGIPIESDREEKWMQLLNQAHIAGSDTSL
ncbi:hypothetical protein [Mechercharimyces sp. CAU 1602]|uniref:hypothetical protein n=1 Tax=Mechercharimyces sp. CAU 1602 TaxID=2973933 RepID=UPI002163A7F7|nr:hypothetical protein [Mechercharimyces sp. CAU 1602]